MIRFASIFVALGLAAAGSTALAAPAAMTDAQMEDVTAGSLTLVFNNSLNNWSIGDGTLIVNFIANVNTAIANGGDASAGQSVGSQTITTILPPPATTTLTASRHGRH